MPSDDDDIEAISKSDQEEQPRRRDPEVPEADALDQAREVVPGERWTRSSRAIDVPEADAIEQAIEEPLDLDDEPLPPEDREAI